MLCFVFKTIKSAWSKALECLPNWQILKFLKKQGTEEIDFDTIKNALKQALEYLPDWQNLTTLEKGKVIDKSFKKIMKDLMDQFKMEPGIDYVDNLKDNEPITDFVALSQRADDLILGLLNGKIIAVKKHSRVSKLGKEFIVEAYFRKKISYKLLGL